MSNILQVEFFRLKKSKVFWALFGVSAGLPFVTAVIYVALMGFVEVIAGSDIGSMWEFIRMAGVAEATLGGTSSVMGDTTLLSVICVSIFLSRDFNNGTFRNMLLANKTRLEMYLSHLVMAVTIGACYFGVSFVSTLFIYGVVFGFGTLTFVKAFTGCLVALVMGMVSVVFVQTMTCMFLFGTRKLAVALACPIAICIFAPSFLLAFVQMYDVFNIFATGELVSTDLSWIPLYNSGLLNIGDLDGALIGKILMYNLPFSVLFGFMGWVTFRKADLK